MNTVVTPAAGPDGQRRLRLHDARAVLDTPPDPVPDHLFELPDAAADPRFAANPLVTGAPHGRAHAGMPLTVAGQHVGMPCPKDHRPLQLGPVQPCLLADLAQAVAHWFESRRQLLELQAERGVQAQLGAARDSAALAVHADRLRLRQMLVNPLGNGIKDNRRGSRLDWRCGVDTALGGLRSIALSAGAMPEQAAQARAAGCDADWTKPLNVCTLAERIESARADADGRRAATAGVLSCVPT